MINEKVKYWVELSDYDLKTAEAMLKTERFLYVGFMCHQAVEKIIKSLHSNRDKNPPFIHDLFRLLKDVNLFEELTEDQEKFISLLQPMNIQARYPAYKDLLYKSLTKEVCEKLITDTKEFVNWIKTKL